TARACGTPVSAGPIARQEPDRYSGSRDGDDAGRRCMASGAPPISSIPLTAIYAARDRIAGSVTRTPLIRLNLDDAPSTIYLKLENLQPIGSFKLRGASNAMALA